MGTDRALLQVGILDDSFNNSVELDAVSASVRQVMARLPEVHDEILGDNKNEPCLRAGPKGEDAEKYAMRKIQWHMCRKEELGEFRMEVWHL